MYETYYKQAVMVGVSRFESADDSIQVDIPEESKEEPKEELPEESKEEPKEELPEESKEEPTKDVSDGDSGSNDVSSGDGESTVSGGDISSGDVSDGDVSDGNPDTNRTATNVAPVVTSTCLYEPKPNLWESDIQDYDTTDGLLLLILIFTIINTAFNVLRKRG